jgi:hypothetical protein
MEIHVGGYIDGWAVGGGRWAGGWRVVGVAPEGNWPIRVKVAELTEAIALKGVYICSLVGSLVPRAGICNRPVRSRWPGMYVIPCYPLRDPCASRVVSAATPPPWISLL